MAQETSKKGQFNLGVEGGVQFTNIKNFSSLYQPKSKTGYSAGVVGEYYVSNSFKVFVGASYDNRKFQLDGQLPYMVETIEDTTYVYGNSFYLYQVNYSLNYVTIPFGIAYERGSEKFKILLKLNLYYSLFLNANMNGGEIFYIDSLDNAHLPESRWEEEYNEFPIEGNTTGIAWANLNKDSNTDYLYENFNSYDFGVNFSIGALYNITPQIGISATVGFTYDMTNFFENPELESRWSAITKINVGVFYTFKKK